uniref:hypothetical protein n=1 Tax=Amycolatopsis sp. CA-096443 TaxID=3239919 RepID=UPI003F497F97
MVAALRKIAQERDSIELADEIIAQVCAIVDGPDNASASDALCQSCAGLWLISQPS